MNTFVFRKQYWEALKFLEPKQRLEALENIIMYGVTGQCEKPSNEVVSVCYLICTSIKADNERYLQRKAENAEDE